MYNHLLCFRDLHVFSKIFSFLFCLLSIVMVNNPLYYLIIIGMFYVLLQNKKMFLVEILLLFLFSIVNFFGIILKFFVTLKGKNVLK